MGRPSIFTDELQDKIVAKIEIGCTREAAAGAAGISRSCLQEWLKRGKEGDPRYIAFADAVKKAEFCAENEAVTEIRKAGQTGVWQASAWYLERHNPQKWGSSRYEIAMMKRRLDALEKQLAGKAKPQEGE